MTYSNPGIQREYQKNWKAKRRQEWLASHGSCAKCGSWESLEIDHIDPKQKVSHKIWTWSKERMETELLKCQVLCHNCHIAKTSNEHRKPVRHGTHTAYASGCRCLSCRQGHREYMVVWHQAVASKLNM